MPKLTFPAAGEAMPAAKLNRRIAILGSLTAAAALSAAPKAIAEQSPIMKLFREWEAAWKRAGTEPDNPELDGLVDLCNELEARMLALPSTSAADFAAKFIAHNGNGDFVIEADSPFRAEAAALVKERAS